MKKPKSILTPLDDRVLRGLRAGDRVLLSGEVYTARDVAHRRLYEAILRRKKNPHPHPRRDLLLRGTDAGEARPGYRLPGSHDEFADGSLHDKTPGNGFEGMIGKGRRSAEVIEAMKKYGAVYFGAIGGAAASWSMRSQADIAAYGEMGPEAIMRLTIEDLPLVVVNDIKGGDLYEKAQHRFRNRNSFLK